MKPEPLTVPAKADPGLAVPTFREALRTQPLRALDSLPLLAAYFCLQRGDSRIQTAAVVMWIAVGVFAMGIAWALNEVMRRGGTGGFVRAMWTLLIAFVLVASSPWIVRTTAVGAVIAGTQAVLSAFGIAMLSLCSAWKRGKELDRYPRLRRLRRWRSRSALIGGLSLLVTGVFFKVYPLFLFPSLAVAFPTAVLISGINCGDRLDGHYWHEIQSRPLSRAETLVAAEALAEYTERTTFRMPNQAEDWLENAARSGQLPESLTDRIYMAAFALELWTPWRTPVSGFNVRLESRYRLWMSHSWIALEGAWLDGQATLGPAQDFARPLQLLHTLHQPAVWVAGTPGVRHVKFVVWLIAGEPGRYPDPPLVWRPDGLVAPASAIWMRRIVLDTAVEAR